MKVVRNFAFLLAAVAWFSFNETPVRADPSEPCDISCSWSGQSCCNVGDLQCGGSGSGSGLCMYCLGLGGDEGASCSAYVGEEEFEGTICQCESPI